jgi:hypothetical protein
MFIDFFGLFKRLAGLGNKRILRKVNEIVNCGNNKLTLVQGLLFSDSFFNICFLIEEPIMPPAIPPTIKPPIISKINKPAKILNKPPRIPPTISPINAPIKIYLSPGPADGGFSGLCFGSYCLSNSHSIRLVSKSLGLNM